MTEAQSRRLPILDAYRRAGEPLATVLLPASSDIEDADARYDIRVKNTLTELVDLGAGTPLLSTVEEALAQFDHGDGAALALVASSDSVVLFLPMFRPVDRLFVSLGPTPSLLPLLAATQSDLPHAAVLLDRKGADLWFRSDLGAPVRTTSIQGDEEHIHRGHPGGWSQRRFQQIAENTWEDNAKVVVEALDGDDFETGIVVAGGDERAVGFFAEHLPDRLGEFVVVDGSRAAGPEAFLDNADVAIRSIAADRLTQELERLRSSLARGGAVEGVDVLDMLGQARVSHLYVADDTLADRRWVERFDFSVPLARHGNSTSECPATEGAVALAVATGAEVTVVPRGAVDQPLVGTLRG